MNPARNKLICGIDKTPVRIWLRAPKPKYLCYDR